MLHEETVQILLSLLVGIRKYQIIYHTHLLWIGGEERFQDLNQSKGNQFVGSAGGFDENKFGEIH